MVHSMAGLAQGVSSVLPNQKAPALAELYASMQSQRPQLIASATGMCNAMAAASYVTLSDSELQQYLGFLSTTAGQRLVDAMVKAFDKAFFSAAKEFGRRIMISPKIGTKGQL
jgi:argininosuccinate lyase